MKFPSAVAMERWPWAVRGLLGCVAAILAVALTYSVQPLRAFPLLLAFPTVILTSWFLGMWGGVLCALTDVILVDAFLTKPQFRLSIGDEREELRLAMFLFISIFLGWMIRRLAQQRAQLATQELNQRLILADAERKLAEERARIGNALRDRDEMLQIALRANGMGLWVWDFEQGTVDRSEEMFRMLGREPGSFGEEPDEWLKFVHPEDREGLIEQFQQIRATAADYHRQYRVVWPDGSVHWLESQGKCQKNSDGRATRIVGVIADITHRKNAEEAMLRAEKLAVAGKLAASVAHEINNPLAAVANLLYLISLAETAEAARSQAQVALEELMRISLITQQTLKFHRQAGAPKPTLLSEVVESVLVLFRAKLQAAQIAVEVCVKTETAVACLPGETQQIFANLLANSIEAMPRNGRILIRLRESCDWRDRATAGMRVTFCDSGSGMNRATIRRIFEPFFTTKPDTGTGLGLWVVSQLAERHNGHVRVWSWQCAQSNGTAFSVFLPRGSELPAEEQADSATAELGALAVEE
ncbi:MAG: PAS domain-containing protein [Terracidiphilus sp.]